MAAHRVSLIPPALVALSLLPTARADCWFDDDNFEHCSLSNGARIGIAIAIIILALLFIASAFSYRRRRMQQFTNTTYTTSQGQGYSQGPYAAPPYGVQPAPYHTGYAPNGPQYPPQTYNGYNPQAGFAPPQGPPPGYYAPPQGSPMPGKEQSV